MNAAELIRRLGANAEAIRGATAGVDVAEARWKEAADIWSILEVVRHLLDEEREDFRARLDLTLHRPDADWPSIDPAVWPNERRYNEQPFADTLARFVAERAHSIDWLRSLRAPEWEREHRHPRFGSIAAGSLLTAWVTHDYLHLRQIARIRHLYTAQLGAPFDGSYAGAW